jgi:AcrR family transcriptional regulator
VRRTSCPTRVIVLVGRTGRGKSGVLHYFGSREAIFLEILDRNRGTWLQRLTAELPEVQPGPGRYGSETAIASASAQSHRGAAFV